MYYLGADISIHGNIYYVAIYIFGIFQLRKRLCEGMNSIANDAGTSWIPRRREMADTIELSNDQSRLCVCVCKCMYVWEGVHVYVCVCVCVCVCVKCEMCSVWLSIVSTSVLHFLWVGVWTPTHTHTHTHTHLWAAISDTHNKVCVCVCECVCESVCALFNN